MVIEWLKFQVKPQLREKFIQEDAKIWTPFLEQYPAFISKEVWINSEKAEEVIFIIRWLNREEWKAIPQNLIEAREKEFTAALGENEYKMIEASEYQVRKFPN